MKKSAVSLALTASLLGGGAVGATTLTPTLNVAQQTTDQAPSDAAPDQDRKVKAADGLAEVLAPLLEDGTLTQAQVDAVVETVVGAREEARQDNKQRRQDRRTERLDSLAEATGIDADVWSEGFKSGATTAETAEANGLSTDELVDIIVTQRLAKLDEAVANGRIDADKATELGETLEERVTKRVNGERPERPERPEGRQGRRGHGDRPGN